MSNKVTDEDEALLRELGVLVEVEDKPELTAEQERIIAGFEEIQRFVSEHGHPPAHGEDRDIFERLYAVRLERIRSLPNALELVTPLDHRGLLNGLPEAGTPLEGLSDEEMLAALGVEVPESSITELKHVRSTSERKAAENVASRQPCEDFDRFKPLFDQVQAELESGMRQTRSFGRRAEIDVGRWFILNGQKAYIAEKGQVFSSDDGERDARLRVIFDNATETPMLMRSLQRALNKDPAGRRIMDPDAGPLFAKTANLQAELDDDDFSTGTIYVLRTKSTVPAIASKRQLLHKIGVTNGPVERRIAGAAKSPTYLMADVEVVAEFQLYNFGRKKFESMLHQLFAAVRADIEVDNALGEKIRVREWFEVPFSVIEKAVDKIQDGSITGWAYDPASASLVRVQTR